jgi:hypothetical protein
MSNRNDWSSERLAKVQRLIPSLFKLVDELNKEFASEQRKFTPDGHMVGSIGEVVAAYAFDLELLPASTKNHDARTTDGKLVQIKLTGSKSIGLRDQPHHLLVLRFQEVRFKLVYNGPGDLVWKNCGPRQMNGQRAIGITKLLTLDAGASPKIRQMRDFPL